MKKILDIKAYLDTIGKNGIPSSEEYWSMI